MKTDTFRPDLLRNSTADQAANGTFPASATQSNHSSGRVDHANESANLDYGEDEADAGADAELEALLADHHAGRRAPLYPSTFDMPVMIDRTLAERFGTYAEWIYWPN